MTHLLDNTVAIDVDNDHLMGWGGGLAKLRDVRVDDAVIGAAFFDPHLTVPTNDPKGRHAGDGIVTKNTLDDWRGFDRRFAGLRFVPEWYGAPEPGVMAKILSDEIARFDDVGIRRVDVFELDVETHDVEYQTKLLLGYTTSGKVRVKGVRGCGGDYPDPTKPWTLGYRWARPGVYTFEGRQSTAQSAGDVAARCGLKIGPQGYNGAMSERWDVSREVAYWLRTVGVSPSFFMPYVDAKKDGRPFGMRDVVLFATTRLTELYQ
jgi:hypothetical protein